MFNGFRRRVGLSYSRFRFRKERDRQTDFPEAFARARRALVLYPESPIDADSSVALLRFLSDRFSDGLTVVIRQDLRSAVSTVPRLKTVTYDPTDVTRWYTPRSGLVRRMNVSTFDLALDLNTQLMLVSAFLCKASSAPLRISFAKEQGDRFYNVQFQSRGSSSTPARYPGVMRCLEMFVRS